MSTAAEILDLSAALLNDTAQAVYTDSVQLPYLNIALRELQEHFELNNVPVTNRLSAALTIPIGGTTLSFVTVPALPLDLIDIQQLWERISGSDPYTPMTRAEFLPRYMEGVTTNQFTWWTWINQTISFLPANIAIDVKLDYIASLFVTITDVNSQISVINADTFLAYRTAGLCSQFIGENPERAQELNGDAVMAIDRSTGINTKGRQAIAVRRRPFMAAYKTRQYF